MIWGGEKWWSLETCHEHQNLVSWNGGIKGMSTGSAALRYDSNPQATAWLAWFADIFSCWTPFLPFSSISEPDPRLLVYTEKSSKCYKTWFHFLSPA